MDRRGALVGRTFGVIGRIIVIHAGKNGGWHPEDHVLDAQAWRDRPGLQMTVDVTVAESIEESGLLLLVPHATIDDEIDAVPQRLGEAGSGAGALLIAVVERRAGAGAGGDEFVDAD